MPTPKSVDKKKRLLPYLAIGVQASLSVTWSPAFSRGGFFLVRVLLSGLCNLY